jgi:hypothetical protein
MKTILLLFLHLEYEENIALYSPPEEIEERVTPFFGS